MFNYTCQLTSGDGFGGDWSYELGVTGTNSGGLVIIDQDTLNPWHEEHDLTGPGTSHGVTLVGAHAVPLDQTANVSSLFQCSMDSLMVWRYEVYPPEGGNVPADCVVASGFETTPDTVWWADFGGCANGNNW